MADILIVDDEKNILEGLALELESAGHVVRTARNGIAALAAYREKIPDLILLDVMMPKMGGYAVCSEIRRTDPVTPILFLTAKDAEIDRVHGLDLGADDYIGKTSGPYEICARVRAVLRRVSTRTIGDVFRFGTVEIDADRLMVIYADGSSVALYPREVKFLKLLAANPNIPVSRAQILEALNGERLFAGSHAIEQMVSRVRLRLGAAAACIETLRNVGYRYVP